MTVTIERPVLHSACWLLPCRLLAVLTACLTADPAPSVSAILSLRPVRLLLRIPAIREMLVALAGSVASLGTLGGSVSSRRRRLISQPGQGSSG